MQLLPPSPICHCWPWRLRHMHDGPTHGARCCHCDREIAAPDAARGKHVACIYCGLERGDVPAVDVPPYETIPEMNL